MLAGLSALELEAAPAAAEPAGARAPSSASASAPPAEVLVRLVTGVAPLRLPSTGAVAVPAALTRAGLTAVVHHLLGPAALAGAGAAAAGAELEFFLPRGAAGGGGGGGTVLLRGSLGAHLAALRVPREATVTLEYALPAPPPQARPPVPHDDWLGAVDGGETCVAARAAANSRARRRCSTPSPLSPLPPAAIAASWPSARTTAA